MSKSTRIANTSDVQSTESDELEWIGDDGDFENLERIITAKLFSSKALTFNQSNNMRAVLVASVSHWKLCFIEVIQHHNHVAMSSTLLCYRSWLVFIGW